MCPLEQDSAKRAARDLGTGWKVNPYIVLHPGETFTIADIQASGVIEHIWLTPHRPLAQHDSADVLGRSGTAQHGVPYRRFFLHGLE